MRPDHETVTRSSNWLRKLPADLVGALLERATPFRAATGRLIYELDDDCNGIYGLTAGVAGVRNITPGAETMFGHLLGAGAWVGAIPVLTGEQRYFGLLALTPCEMLHIPLTALNDLGRSDPRIWRALAVLAALNSAIAMQVARDVLILDPRDRCLSVLDRLQGAVGHGADIPLTQDQLAHMCQMSRGALSRILSNLEAEGRIERNYRSIRVLPPSQPTRA